MRMELEKKAREYIERGKKRRRFRAMIVSLALAVALGTFYILSSPALTLDGDPNHIAGDSLQAQTPSEAVIDPDEVPTVNPEELSDNGGNTAESVPDTAEEPAGDAADGDAGHTTEENNGEGAGENIGENGNGDAGENTGESADESIGEPADESAEEPAGEDTGSEGGQAAGGASSEAVLPVTEFVFEAEGLKVTAVLSDPSALPAGAELTALRVTGESDPEQYEQLRQLLLENTGEASDFAAYDISFLLDGQEVEPSGDTVSVTIEDEETPAASADSVQMFHVLEEEGAVPSLKEIAAEVSEPEAELKQVSFTAESFSFYLVKPVVYSSYAAKVISTEEDTFTHTAYYNSGSPLGIAGSFHIVAFDTATLNAHTNGNILARKLYAGSNFGTQNLANELTYVQNYVQVNSNSASADGQVLVIGSANTVTLMDNGNALGINGTKIDRPGKAYIWQDADTASLPFIDLDTVREQAGSVSSMLQNMSSSTEQVLENHLKDNKSPYYGSETESYLLLKNSDGVGVFNITGSDLMKYQYVSIKGLESGHNGTVVINVDCSGLNSLTMPKSNLFINGSRVPLSNVTNFVNGKVIWNFYNCKENMPLTASELYGTILAPDAAVSTVSNVNGTIIGNQVRIGGESHRDDFVGKLTDGIVVKKVWLGRDGSALSGEELAGVSVTVQLYQIQNDGSRTEYGDPVTLDTDGGWSHLWEELPEGYSYAAEEVRVLKNGEDVTGQYHVSYSSQGGITSGTLQITNQRQYVLPNTGGTGLLPYTLGGMALMLGTLSAVWLRKKRVS